MRRSHSYLLMIVTLWLLLMFCQSLLPAAVSAIQSGWVLELVCGLLPLPLTMHMVRKGAHLLEFFVLGVLTAGMCRRHCGRRLIWFLTAAASGMAAGLCDETLQLFAEGRSGNLADVWLEGTPMPVVDSLGDEFLEYVKTGMTVTVKEDGVVEVG